MIFVVRNSFGQDLAIFFKEELANKCFGQLNDAHDIVQLNFEEWVGLR